MPFLCPIDFSALLLDSDILVKPFSSIRCIVWKFIVFFIKSFYATTIRYI